MQRITYAKSKSYATSRREDPNFVPPTAVHANQNAALLEKVTVSSIDKRRRDEDMADGQPKPKREKSQEEDSSDGEEMEIDEDEDAAPSHKPLGMRISPYKPCSHDFIALHKSHYSTAYATPICKIVLHESSSRSNR